MKKFKKKYAIAVLVIALVIIFFHYFFCLVGMIKEKVMVFYGMESKL